MKALADSKVANSRLRRWALPLFAAIAALGGVATWQTARLTDRDMRARLLTEGRMIAQAVNANRFLTLTGSKDDLTNADYQRLKQQLMLIRSANPACRFIYLMGQRPDKSIFFFVDSEPPESGDYSPPGQSYGEISDGDLRVFTTRQPATVGPAADRWGSWMSAMVPLTDPKTDALIAVLGMDVDARAWNRTIAARCVGPVATVAFVVFLLGTFIHLQHRTAREAARLSASEARYRTLFVGSRDAIMTLESPAWRFTSGNPAAVSMFKAASEREFTACEPWALSPERQPDERLSAEKAIEMIETAMREGSHSFEWTHVRIGGEEFPATVLLTRMEVGGKVFLQATVRDVTERKQAEATLRKREELLNAVGAMASVGGWDLDVATGAVRWTREMYRIHDIPEGTSMDLSQAILFFDMPERSALEAAVPLAMETGAPFDLELPFTSAKGRHLWAHAIGRAVMANGKAVQLTGTFQDITGRRRAEEELRFQNVLLATQQEASIDGILVADGDGAILSFNRRFVTMWGIPTEVLETRSDERALQSVLDKLAEPGLFIEKVKHLYRHRDESSHDEVVLKDGRVFDRHSAPMVGADGHYYGRVWFFRDISERVALESALRQQHTLASTGTLASGMAHEINNPLNGIMNYAELIRDRAADNAPLIGFAVEILTEGRRMARMTQSLLSYTQQAEPRAMTLASVADVAGSMVASVAASARERGIVVTCEMAADWPPVSCRKGQLDQVVGGLLANAMEAWEEAPAEDRRLQARGGEKRIVVSVREVVISDRLSGRNTEHRTPNTHRWLRLTVADNGPGIPAAIRERMFDPFFTTKDRTRHSGLGLWISRSIIQEHGGDLSIESAEGHGTRVHVELPAQSNSEGGT